MTRALSRAELIHRGAVGAAALLGTGGILAATARASGPPADDARSLATALRLEYVQAAFYEQAVQEGTIGPEMLDFARAAAAHEREHIAALRALIGAAAGDPPRLDLPARGGGDVAFAQTAIVLENLSVRALNGQVAHLGPRALAETARIASVDARHGAWIRGIAGGTPEHHVLDEGRSDDEILDALRRAGLTPGTAS